MPRHIHLKPTLELRAWKYMRLSAILLVPLVWVHAALNTLVIGAENINLTLVQQRWATIGWQVYDVLLLAFAFSHGVNGFRQILLDFINPVRVRTVINLASFFFWLFLSFIGASAILGVEITALQGVSP